MTIVFLIGQKVSVSQFVCFHLWQWLNV